jgi:hypothetical protein
MPADFTLGKNEGLKLCPEQWLCVVVSVKQFWRNILKRKKLFFKIIHKNQSVNGEGNPLHMKWHDGINM